MCCCEAHWFIGFGVQVVSMAADNVIKVWDLRNHRCIQTITDVDWPSQEDAHPSAMMYDPARSAVLLPSHIYKKLPCKWARLACSAQVQRT